MFGLAVYRPLDDRVIVWLGVSRNIVSDFLGNFSLTSIDQKNYDECIREEGRPLGNG
jgi:hypothetical protein